MSKNKIKYGLQGVHIAFKGVCQTESIEVTGVPSSDGDITLTITAETLLEGASPADVIVPLNSTTHNTVKKVASAIVDALNNDDDVSPVFWARHDGGKIYLITKIAQENDGTLDISFADTDTTGTTMDSSTSVTDGTDGWGAPKPIKGAVGLSTSPEGDENDFFADNTKYYTQSTNNGYTGDLEVANIPDDILAEMLGMTIDNNGMVIESTDDRQKEFALMGQVQGDVRNRRFVYYRCKAARPSQEASTSEASITPTTDTANITMLGVEGVMTDKKVVKAVMELSDDNQDAYDSFFDSVIMPAV